MSRRGSCQRQYKQLGERPDELLPRLAARLAPEDQELLREYDDVSFEPVIRRDELFYTGGLTDGILFGYWVAMVGRGMEKIRV